MAVDDSTSMRENNVNELVDQSLAVLCQSLSSLEVGKFGLVKFGKEPEVIQSLQVCTYKKACKNKKKKYSNYIQNFNKNSLLIIGQIFSR